MLQPDIHADPYPLYHELRNHAPVFWDPYLHAWVVTGYAEALTVLQNYCADRTPSPEQLRSMGLSGLEPVAEMMVRQMLFLDGPAHARLRGLCSAAFTPRRVARLAEHIQGIADELIDALPPNGVFDAMAAIAAPLPAIVTAELLGVPRADHPQLKAWSADFAEFLGNFQHNPDRAAGLLLSLGEMTAYFRAAVRAASTHRPDSLIRALVESRLQGARLTEDEIVANIIVTMVGGQETTTNLIGNGLLTLLRDPSALAMMRDRPDIADSAIEELLRFESPSQHTARLVPEDTTLGGNALRRRDAVIVVMAAANRDPARFPDPDRLDLCRPDNRHLAFGWAAHFCFGAPLARMEGRIVFETVLRRLPGLALAERALVWRPNLGLRGLEALWLMKDSPGLSDRNELERSSLLETRAAAKQAVSA